MDGKKKRRKGYTLIECLAYISISSIILLMIMNLSIEGYKYSIYRVEKLKREDEIDNAILNMRKIFNEKDNTKYRVVDGYIRILKEKEGFEEVKNEENNGSSTVFTNGKEIKLNGKDLRVYYYYFDSKENGDLKTSNLILKDVSKCKFFKKDNIMYMNLEIDSREYLICI
ncbi:prepilin-type N-terminal cleavage/methylation domain-containing protein [Clostridium baratii]|uniref:prepilin-type N-terminal cleavage/methylation domain-containing protein n=1 Tax=Clostridium baratii TaxID=1561 RepID=UPI002910345D|nr:prepilin-type N-terminal cleavage/methylation domain-containing protein [Clostridium baratii]MDU4910523.1 prepilin-type N-terminal cleavage/methylation domain-containing protein [Clostridium baratii]